MSWEEHRVFENRMVRRIFGPKRDEVTGGWRKLHNEELHNLYSSPSIIRMIKSRRVRQRAVIEFLCCGNETVGNLHKRLKNVCGDEAVDRSSVGRWARRLSGEGGHTNIRDSPRTGTPHTAQTPDNVQRVNDMVLEDRCVTLGIGEVTVCRILKELELKKVCAKRVPRMLTDNHKETRKTVHGEPLAQYNPWHSMRLVEMTFLGEF
ncbi:hypothetical protein B7P43_G02536 [Cryptotermes secundus]|uniref:Mos1 transposase HTH domain-containing protein n=1 Tax=Cryptotermes secundus TaxID=105785 RepID=A0A2J7QNQ9_9NEOP|nr:hypothetical protein B7P43_G02536 [Cryptotermes secundus]